MNENVIIIVGLPGSGKTTLAKTFTEHVLYDDFLDIFIHGTIQKALRDGRKICLTDPRLCNYNTFVKYITQLKLGEYELILFKNDVDACIANVKRRDNNIKADRVINDILKLSKIYDVTNYENGIIKDVYIDDK